ncbi:MAG: DUF3971 domain-containing protein, partial [Campylobacteraceae bacterium]
MEIKDINISKSSSSDDKSSLDSLDSILNSIPMMNLFFDTIDLQNISYEDETIKALYKDDSIFVDSKYLTLKTRIVSYKNRHVVLGIDELILKDYKANLNGTLDADLANDIYSTNIDFGLYGINGNASVTSDGRFVNFEVSTNKVNSIDDFMDNLRLHVNLSEETANWIYKDIKASSYQIISLNGKVDTYKNSVDLLEIGGKAIAKDVNVTFDKSLPAATIELVDIDFRDGGLFFNPTNTTYDGIVVNNASVAIENLIANNKDITIGINIATTNAKLDKKIHNILTAFNVTVPVYQLSGNTDANLTLLITPEPFALDINGLFKVTNANITRANVSMYTPIANVKLNNTNITINDSTLVMKPIFNITADTFLDIEKQVMYSNATINSFKVEAG